MLKETDFEEPVIVESVITEIVEPKPEGRMELCREHISHGWKSYVKINSTQLLLMKEVPITIFSIMNMTSFISV